MINTLLLTLFCFTIISYFPPQVRSVKIIVFICLAIVLIIIAGFRGEGIDRDYSNYISYFHEQDFLIVEPSFVLISKIIHFLIGPYPIFLFIIFAILGVSLKFIAIKQLTELWFLSLVVYVSNFYILQDLTQIRAGVASSFLLLCIKPIHERNWKKFLLFSLLGFSFHYSAALIFPLWFLSGKSSKKWLFFSIPIAYLVYFSGINLINIIPIPGIQDKIEIYKKLQELGGDEQWDSINVFNLLFLTRIVIFYVLLWKYDLITKSNVYFPILIKIYCISLIALIILALMPVFGFRTNEFFGISEIIIIPMLAYVFKPFYFSKAIISIIGLGMIYIILFYSKLIT